MKLISAALIIKNNKVLIGKKEDDPNHPFGIGGKWSLPGGRLNEGEDPEMGLKREVREETNLDVQITSTLGKQKLGTKGIVFFFECAPKNTGEERAMDDLVEIKWVDRKDVLKLFDRDVIGMLSKEVKGYLRS